MPASAPTPPSELERFELELEFVQALANPSYAHFLALEGFLDDDRMIRFIHHLQYFERPEYARFVLYPHALAFRRALTSKAFRRAMANPRFARQCAETQRATWTRGPGRGEDDG